MKRTKNTFQYICWLENQQQTSYKIRFNVIMMEILFCWEYKLLPFPFFRLSNFFNVLILIN